MKGKGKSFLVHIMRAQIGIRGITLPILNHGARWGEWSTSRPGRCTTGKEPWYAVNREAESTIEPVWTIWRRENTLYSTGIRTTGHYNAYAVPALPDVDWFVKIRRL